MNVIKKGLHSEIEGKHSWLKLCFVWLYISGELCLQGIWVHSAGRHLALKIWQPCGKARPRNQTVVFWNLYCKNYFKIQLYWFSCFWQQTNQLTLFAIHGNKKSFTVSSAEWVTIPEWPETRTKRMNLQRLDSRLPEFSPRLLLEGAIPWCK